MENDGKKKLIKRLQDIDVVQKQAVTLKYAGSSPFYIDIKKAYGYPDVLSLMCGLARKEMDKSVMCIASAGYGGLPLASAIAFKYSLQLTLVREKAKGHGRNVWIDGYVPTVNDIVWVVDDVFTTGKSVTQIIKTVRRTNAAIAGCTVVVKRGEGTIAIPVNHLIDAAELV